MQINTTGRKTSGESLTTAVNIDKDLGERHLEDESMKDGAENCHNSKGRSSCKP